MKKHFNFILLVIFSFSSFSYSLGQTFDLNLNAIMKKNNGEWKKDDKITITKFVHETQEFTTPELTHNNTYRTKVTYKELFYLEDANGTQVEINSKVDDCFIFEYNTIQDLWDASIISNILYSLKKNGFQYDLRSEMESEALDYIQKVRNSGLELDDPYLETYVYSLIAKIAPQQLIDGRPSSINLLIQENPSIDACCFPNGTIVLNTGLLASLHSEDELVAILAHEIAHFVLDHQIQNINEAVSRQKRAEFWAGLATGLTALGEGYLAVQNPYYSPGAATLGMAMISSSIASQVIERLGMKYNHNQELEADVLARKTLEILGYDQCALASALSRIKSEYIQERNNVAYLDSYTHPALISRIKMAGTPANNRDKTFEQNISFAVSSVALMKYSDRRFHQCLSFVNQNIENGVATVDDYILKANCLLYTKNDFDSNQDVITLLNKAKNLDKNNPNIYKAEILATLRIGNKTSAVEQLQQYINVLNSFNLNDINSSKSWEKINNFINTELNWASKMLIKLNGM